MSAKVKHLYRVTAVWAGTTTRRDYQTKAAAEHHAAVLRAARDLEVTYRVAATSVTVTTSDPITWPTS